MKKKRFPIQVLVLVLAAAVSLAACGKGSSENVLPSPEKDPGTQPLPTATPYESLAGWQDAQEEGTLDTLEDAQLATAVPATEKPAQATARPSDPAEGTDTPAGQPEPAATPVPTDALIEDDAPIELPLVPID